jgi:hypothetical protein
MISSLTPPKFLILPRRTLINRDISHKVPRRGLASSCLLELPFAEVFLESILLSSTSKPCLLSFLVSRKTSRFHAQILSTTMRLAIQIVGATRAAPFSSPSLTLREELWLHLPLLPRCRPCPRRKHLSFSSRRQSWRIVFSETPVAPTLFACNILKI